MSIQFDPFSFGVASFALAISIIQLYWNRPQHRTQVWVCNPQGVSTSTDHCEQMVEELYMINGQA
jgi:hypothetical protein